MADNPRTTLQRLVQIALDLCAADTSGISLLDGDVFRWEAVAGLFAAARGGMIPLRVRPVVHADGRRDDRAAHRIEHRVSTPAAASRS